MLYTWLPGCPMNVAVGSSARAPAVPVDGSRLAAGLYHATVLLNGQVVSKKTIKR